MTLKLLQRSTALPLTQSSMTATQIVGITLIIISLLITIPMAFWAVETWQAYRFFVAIGLPLLVMFVGFYFSLFH